MPESRECDEEGCYWSRVYRDKPLMSFRGRGLQKKPLASECVLPGKEKIYYPDKLIDRLRIRAFLLVHPGEIATDGIKKMLANRRTGRQKV